MCTGGQEFFEGSGPFCQISGKKKIFCPRCGSRNILSKEERYAKYDPDELVPTDYSCSDCGHKFNQEK